MKPNLMSGSVKLPFQSFDDFSSPVARSQLVNVFDLAAAKRTDFHFFSARNADLAVAAWNNRSLLISLFRKNLAANFAKFGHFLKFYIMFGKNLNI